MGDYKEVTAIHSNTRLDVDKAFTQTYNDNDYNYESCWLSLGVEGGVATSSRNAEMSSYTNKKVYVEDACEIKPGCESNPWALTVPQTQITCPAWAGTTSSHGPSNCDYWYIGVRGDNRYPHKTGASEYDLYVYTE